MNEAVIVFGGVVILLSAVFTAALEFSSIWKRIAAFFLGVIILITMAGLGAMMGIIIREAVKAFGP